MPILPIFCCFDGIAGLPRGGATRVLKDIYFVKVVTSWKQGRVFVHIFTMLCQPPPIRTGTGGGELMRATARRAALAVFSQKRVPYAHIIHKIHTAFSGSNTDTY